MDGAPLERREEGTDAPLERREVMVMAGAVGNSRSRFLYLPGREVWDGEKSGGDKMSRRKNSPRRGGVCNSAVSNRRPMKIRTP